MEKIATLVIAGLFTLVAFAPPAMAQDGACKPFFGLNPAGHSNLGQGADHVGAACAKQVAS